MLVVQMLVGAVVVAICAVLLYINVRLVVLLGKLAKGDSDLSDDVDYFVTGAFLLVAVIVLGYAFIAGSFLIGEKILTVLGWIG